MRRGNAWLPPIIASSGCRYLAASGQHFYVDSTGHAIEPSISFPLSNGYPPPPPSSWTTDTQFRAPLLKEAKPGNFCVTSSGQSSIPGWHSLRTAPPPSSLRSQCGGKACRTDTHFPGYLQTSSTSIWRDASMRVSNPFTKLYGSFFRCGTPSRRHRTRLSTSRSSSALSQVGSSPPPTPHLVCAIRF